MNTKIQSWLVTLLFFLMDIVYLLEGKLIRFVDRITYYLALRNFIVIRDDSEVSSQDNNQSSYISSIPIGRGLIGYIFILFRSILAGNKAYVDVHTIYDSVAIRGP